MQRGEALGKRNTRRGGNTERLRATCMCIGLQGPVRAVLSWRWRLTRAPTGLRPPRQAMSRYEFKKCLGLRWATVNRPN